MPTLLSDLNPTANVLISNAGQGIHLKNPRLGALVAEAIASWSNVESFMLRMFIALVGGKQAVAANMYLALDGNGPKKAAITAAATAILPPDRLDLFRVIMAIADTNEKSRNKLAHWVWGESPELPGLLLLADPKHIATGDRTVNDIYVYREHDFKTIISANERLCGYWSEFNVGLLHPALEHKFQQLAAEPEIADRLKILKDRKARSTSKSPPQLPPAGTHV
jgi:hypothetical protein